MSKTNVAEDQEIIEQEVVLEYSKNVHAAVTAAIERNPESLEDQIKESIRVVRRMPSFRDHVDRWVDAAIRTLVYSIRHTHTTAAKRESGEYRKKQKVSVAKSKDVRRASRDLLDTAFFGQATLSVVTGKQLDQAAENEAKIASGHMLNVRFARLLRKHVGDHQTVGEALTERQCRDLLARAKRGK